MKHEIGYDAMLQVNGGIALLNDKGLGSSLG